MPNIDSIINVFSAIEMEQNREEEEATMSSSFILFIYRLSASQLTKVVVHGLLKPSITRSLEPFYPAIAHDFSFPFFSLSLFPFFSLFRCRVDCVANTS